MIFEGRITDEMFNRFRQPGSFQQFPELYALLVGKLETMGATKVERFDDPCFLATTLRVTFPDGTDFDAELGMMGLAPLPNAPVLPPGHTVGERGATSDEKAPPPSG